LRTNSLHEKGYDRGLSFESSSGMNFKINSIQKGRFEEEEHLQFKGLEDMKIMTWNTIIE